MTEACPHCDVVADVRPDAALGFCCKVCGGPRLAPGTMATAEARALLESAGREQTKHLLFTAAALFLTPMGALALAIVTGVVLVAAPGPVPSLAAYLAAAVPTIAGLLALAAAAGARTERGRASEICLSCHAAYQRARDNHPRHVYLAERRARSSWPRLPDVIRLYKTGATFAQIAAALDMPIGSIGPTRSRCLSKLREELVAEGVQ